jgi:putative restriction endonuclease
MSSLRELLTTLEERHQRALEWFDDNSGRIVGWPGQLADGTLLASKAKGIYKPAWSKYAISIRQSLDGPYPDKPVLDRPDGTWLFEYFQESLEESQFERQFTNRALLECLADVVPVGVLLQLTPKPSSTYRVLGLALVTGFSAGYFSFEGERSDFVRDRSGILIAPSTSPQQRADFVAGAFDPDRVIDERDKVIRSINVRRGQAGFRRMLLDAYEGRCAISGFDRQ